MLRPGHLLRNDKLAATISGHPGLLCLTICLLWIFFGLIGHAPWKSEEALLIGQISQLNQFDSLFFFSILEDRINFGPIFYFVTTGFIALLSEILIEHDAARLSMAVWLTLTLFFLSQTAKELWGRTQGFLAPLLLIGSAGFLVKSHQLSVIPLVITAMTLFAYGMAVAPRRCIVGGLFIGTGLAIIILEGNSEYLLIPLITIFLMFLTNTRYRSLRFIKTVSVSFGVVSLFLIIWMMTLYQEHPSLLFKWLECLSESTTDSVTAPNLSTLIQPATMLPWYAWPTWLFLFWSLWIEGREGIKRKELQLPIALWLSVTFLMCITNIKSEAELMPILIPFALIGSIAANRLPRGGANALYWFSIMSTLFFVLAAWVYFSASYFGVPRELSEHLLQLQPECQSGNRNNVVFFGILITALWLVFLFNIKRSPERPIIIWSTNLTVGWILTTVLLFHWVDSRKTYGPMIESMTRHINPQHNCIIAQIGPAQRGLVHYFSNLETIDTYKQTEGKSCDYLIHQDRWDNDDSIDLPWRLVWEGGRPGDTAERYRLYKREPE